MYSFEQWRNLVDSIVFIVINLHLDDLPDEDFRINYDNGLHVCDMAKLVIINFNEY